MKLLGRHLIIELYECDPDTLRDQKRVAMIMENAARKAQAQIVATHVHEFSPYGLSGVVIIKESHLTIHTWPEYNYAAVDIFTCGDQLQPERALEVLQEELGAQQIQVKQLDRGLTH